MPLFGPQKDNTVSFNERRKPAQYRNWATFLSTVVLDKLVPQIQAYCDARLVSTKENDRKEIIQQLKDLEPTLVCAYVADSESNSVLTVKRTLLDLWQTLVLYLDKADQSELAPPFFSLILTIIRRPEFDVDRLLASLKGTRTPLSSSQPSLPSVDGSGSPGQHPSLVNSSGRRFEDSQHHDMTAAEIATLEPEVALCERYRLLLFNTLRLVTRKLGAATAQSDLAFIPQNSVRIGKNRSSMRAVPSSPSSPTPASPPAGGCFSPRTPTEKPPTEDDKQSLVSDRPLLEPIIPFGNNLESSAPSPIQIDPSTVPTDPPASIHPSLPVGLTIVPQTAAPAVPADSKDSSTPTESITISAGLEMSKSVAEMLGSPLPSNTDVLDVGSSVGTNATASKESEPSNKPADTSEEPSKVTFLPRSPSRLPLVEKPVTQMAPLFDMFALKFFAVAYWRLPQIQEHILDAMKKRILLPNSLHTFDIKPCYSSSDEEFPQLFRWEEFHRRLKSITFDTEEERFLMLSKRWLAQFAKLGNFFMRFFIEWSNYLREVIAGHPVVWERIPGFVTMANAMFSISGRLVTTDEPAASVTLPHAEVALLGTAHSVVFSTFVRMAYCRTPLRETRAVVGTLLSIDFWLGELMKQHFVLDEHDFDYENFVRGLDVILQTDHHMILARLLTMIYSYGDIFRGKARLAVFRDLLLEKHFFHLFLHWSDNVRSIFCQVLAFKALITKRRVLKADEKHSAAKSKKQPDLATSPHPDSSAPPAVEDDPDAVLSIDLAINAKLEAYIATVFKQFDVLSRQPSPTVPIPESTAVSGSGSQQESVSTTTGRKQYHMEEEQSEEESVLENTNPIPRMPRIPDASLNVLPDALPDHLSVYIIRACDEFKKHMARYNEWQSKNNLEIPNLIAMA